MENRKGGGLLGTPRIRAEDKRIINCDVDLNQLSPLRYVWAWDKYLASCRNNWSPQEINMQKDIAQWAGGHLNEDERHVVKRALGFFSTADSLVANNLVLGIYRLITNPECRQFLLRQAFEEAMHTEAYQLCIESLSMDEGEIYNAYREIPSVAAKAEWALNHTRAISDPQFRTGTLETDRELLCNLIAFYCVVESCFFFAAFAQVFALGRRQLLIGTSEQLQYIARDESGHVNFGLEVIAAIIRENPLVWDSGTREHVRGLLREGADLEIAYIHDTMPRPMLGLNPADMCRYVQFIANRRSEQMGLPPVFAGVTESPLPWMSEMIDLRKEQNFFERQVTNYQANSGLKW